MTRYKKVINKYLENKEFYSKVQQRLISYIDTKTLEASYKRATVDELITEKLGYEDILNYYMRMVIGNFITPDYSDLHAENIASVLNTKVIITLINKELARKEVK